MECPFYNNDLDPIPLKQWTNVLVAQIPDGNSFRFRITINGTILEDQNSTDAREFQEVTAYLRRSFFIGGSILLSLFRMYYSMFMKISVSE